jgi:hypothetical protein
MNLIVKSQPNHFSFVMMICISITGIILLLPILIILLRRLIKKTSDFKSIHNHTDSSASTTSSQIDIGSNLHHRYATIGPVHPHIFCNNENITFPHYAKLIQTTIQQNHIEGICGNSTYGTDRLLTFNLNQNQFIPSQSFDIKRRLENRHQIINGGEVNIEHNSTECLS